MKFIHMADMHFDSPFVNLSQIDTLGDLKRLEQRKAFKKIIEYIKENNIEYFFISGDLYENQYIKQSTIEYINNLFKEIPKTKIFISPGNHDPYLKNSYYNTYKWNDNVKIFNSKIKKIETEDANIYGYGFDDFYCYDSGLKDFQLENNEKLNILVIHASLDGGWDEERVYNSISSKLLKEKGFDYVALGHIHKLDYNTYEDQRIVYPSSPIALGFDEIGEHGIIEGNLEKNKIELKFIKIDDEEFIKKELNITEIKSKEELIEKINNIKIENNQYAEIILIGNRNFEINIYDLLKYIFNNRIIKIKDNTKIAYDLKNIANENTLKGLFTKELLNKLNNENLSQEEKEIIEKAIEIGFDALE